VLTWIAPITMPPPWSCLSSDKRQSKRTTSTATDTLVKSMVAMSSPPGGCDSSARLRILSPPKPPAGAGKASQPRPHSAICGRVLWTVHRPDCGTDCRNAKRQSLRARRDIPGDWAGDDRAPGPHLGHSQTRVCRSTPGLNACPPMCRRMTAASLSRAGAWQAAVSMWSAHEKALHKHPVAKRPPLAGLDVLRLEGGSLARRRICGQDFFGLISPVGSGHSRSLRDNWGH